MTGQIFNLGLASFLVGLVAIALGLWNHSYHNIAIGLLFVLFPLGWLLVTPPATSPKTDERET